MASGKKTYETEFKGWMVQLVRSAGNPGSPRLIRSNAQRWSSSR